MSIPIIVAVAAGGALLFAGSKKNGTPSPGGATDSLDNATKQSTGGDNGGATSPSHAGSESYNGGAETDGSGGMMQVDATSGLNYDDAGSRGVVMDPVRSDPWKQTAGASIDNSKQLDAVKAITTVGAVTGKAAVDSFRSVADAVGLIF